MRGGQGPAKPAADPTTHWATRLEAAKELTVLLGRPVTVRQVHTWQQSGAPLPPGGGEICKVDLLEWVRRHTFKNSGDSLTDRMGDKARREKGEADKIELIVAKMKSELVSKAEYDAATRRMGILLRDRLRLELPSALLTVYTTLPADEAIDRCQGMIDEILSTWGDADDGSAPDPMAAAPQPEDA